MPLFSVHLPKEGRSYHAQPIRGYRRNSEFPPAFHKKTGVIFPITPAVQNSNVTICGSPIPSYQ
jgi:hypothetical protein